MLKSQDGYVFHENQKYLIKKDSSPRQIFIYNAILACRDDMLVYDPFESNTNQQYKDPILSQLSGKEYFSAKLKQDYGYTREELRVATMGFSRNQKILFGIDLLWRKAGCPDVFSFAPNKNDLLPIIGPPITPEQFDNMFVHFKTNPNNVTFLIQGLYNDPGSDSQTDIEPSGRHEGTVSLE